MKIGICDYGIGGIGLYKILRAQTTADIIYFSDAGYTPYGKVPEDELKTRLDIVFNYFKSQDVEYIAVACNAASTVLTAHPQRTGIIEHGLRMVQRLQPNEIAVAGGYRTVESNAYKTPLEQSGMKVSQRVAQPLSIRIEAGDLSSKELSADIAEIFEPVKNVSHILLACTHYPVITNKIAEEVPNAILLDPVNEMAEWIIEHWSPLHGDSTTRWITSGNTQQMISAADAAFQVKISSVENISL
jgi:glutamate racemase